MKKIKNTIKLSNGREVVLYRIPHSSINACKANIFANYNKLEIAEIASELLCYIASEKKIEGMMVMEVCTLLTDDVKLGVKVGDKGFVVENNRGGVIMEMVNNNPLLKDNQRFFFKKQLKNV